MRLTDSSIMPYGKYQGRTMARIPADYLLWLHENGKCSPLVAAYIDEHIEPLKKQVAEAERMRENRQRMRTMYK